MAKKKVTKKTSNKASVKKAPKVTPILVFDTETGGFDPQTNSLLTAAFAAVNPKTWEIIDTLDIKIKRDVYNVTGGALRVNKIDINKHNSDKKALEPADAVQTIIEFLQKNFSKLPAKPAGQNTPFDIGFVTKLFEDVGAVYNDFIHYSYLDTMPVLRLLNLLGDIPDSACSLQGAKRYFGIKQKRSAAHDALGDVEATVELFRELCKGLSTGEGAVDDDDDDDDDNEGTDEQAAEEDKPKKKGKKKSPAKKKGKKVVEEEDDDDDDDEEPEDLDELEEDDDDEEDDDEEEEDDDDDEDEDDDEEDEDDDWED